MKITRTVLIGLSLAAACLSSCKKDDDSSSTLDYLDGSISSVSLPTYVSKGETFTLTPKGVTHPDTGLAEDVGYYWTLSWESSAKDTTKTEADKVSDGTFEFTTPSAVGTYTVGCVAFASNYYSLSWSGSITVVDPALDSTVSNAGYKPASSFADDRDGNIYYTTSFAGKTWTRNNLFYKEAGVSYDNCEAMDPIFGRLYNWKEANQVCPEGWHLPSDAEFAQMANALGNGTFTAGADFKGIAGDLMVNAEFLGERMWEYWPQINITNKTGFSALPVGYATSSGETSSFKGLDEYAAFWTSDSDGDLGVYRYIYVKQDIIYAGSSDKESFRAAVRCVKD